MEAINRFFIMLIKPFFKNLHWKLPDAIGTKFLEFKQKLEI